MKASGISLIHAMRPLIVLIAFISVGAFFFQNDILPPAQVKMYTLLFSMRQKSPELEIPEGVFYDQIPGYNLFVEHKNRDTGMLYGMMIYDVSKGGDNSTILLADSGRLAFTGDMKYLYLHLYKGEQFENLREQKSLDKNVPFRREEFSDKEVLIPFDANFNRLDEGGMRNQYVGKDVKELRHTIDSIGERLDSTGTLYARELKRSAFPILNSPKFQREDDDPSVSTKTEVSDTLITEAPPVNLDSLLRSVSTTQQSQIFNSALDISKRQMTDYQFKSMTVHEDKRLMRRHGIELIRKYTLSVACLIFFFIGAPLGAIIRKGGLGTPLVISVLLFLFYYIIDNAGYKLARDGRWPVWLGIWLSSFVLAPLGVYVTIKAMNDSAVFDADRYKAFFRKILGIKQDRSVAYKEVIINDISTGEAISRLTSLKEMALAFYDRYNGKMSYKDFWTSGIDMTPLAEIIENLEDDVTYMTDCRNNMAVNKLMDYPVVRKLWIYHPGLGNWVGKVGMWLFPIGLPLYFIGMKSKKNLMAEMQKIASVSDSIIDILNTPTPSR